MLFKNYDLKNALYFTHFKIIIIFASFIEIFRTRYNETQKPKWKPTTCGVAIPATEKIFYPQNVLTHSIKLLSLKKVWFETILNFIVGTYRLKDQSFFKLNQMVLNNHYSPLPTNEKVEKTVFSLRVILKYLPTYFFCQ